LEGLEKAYEARSWSLPSLKMDNIFDRLRSEPRFIALPKKGGPDNWRREVSIPEPDHKWDSSI
jgi:hypothetical protein